MPKGGPVGNKKAVGNKGGGRPTGYSPKFATMAAAACRAGFTDAEIAALLGVCERTIGGWKHEHPDFLAALKVGKDESDDRVERSLFARATGYEHPDTDIRVVDGQIVQTALVKHYPPDTTAAIFWLKNRRSATWRDRTETEVTGKDGAPLVPDLSDQEISRRAAFALALALQKPKA